MKNSIIFLVLLLCACSSRPTKVEPTTPQPEFYVFHKEKSAAVFNEADGKFVGIDSSKIIWSDNLLYITLNLTEGCRCEAEVGQVNTFAGDNPNVVIKIHSQVESLLHHRKINDFRLEASQDHPWLFGIWVYLEPEKMATLVYTQEIVNDTVTTVYGDSLWKTFNMRSDQALEYSKRFKKKRTYDDTGALIVIIPTGERVVRDCQSPGGWRPITN